MLFEVENKVLETVVVEADDELHAVGLAYEGLDDRLVSFPPTLRETTRDYPRPITLRCPRCNSVSLKERWGPGFVTCPRCKRHPPTPHEK